jgi:ribosomal protein S18 acetylase RimI-like enzyme
MHAVRRLGVDDAHRFRDMRREARRSDPDAFRGSLAEEDAKPIAWHRERLTEDAVFGAFDARGVLIGMAGFTSSGGSRDEAPGRVWAVYVRPAVRGARIGETLMRAVIAHASGEVPVLHLSVMTANRSARRLYERLGFRLMGIEEGVSPTADGRLRDEALYELELRPDA